MMTKSGWSLSSYLFNMYDGISVDFYLSPTVYVPSGNYQYLSSFNVLSTPLSKPVSCSLTASVGGYYDGNRLSLTLEPVFNVSSSLQLSTSYGYNKLTFGARNQEFISRITSYNVCYTKLLRNV